MSSVPDFTKPAGTFDLTLQKVGVKLDGADNAFQYVLDLAFPITGRGVAENMEAQIPGLGDAFDEAIEDTNNWRGSSVVKSDLDVRAVLHAKIAPTGIAQGPVEPGGVVIQGSARVAHIRADLSKKQQRVLVRLVMGGQSATVAGALVATLERLVTFSYERTQAELPFNSRAGARPPLRVGMVATLGGEAGIRGRVVELDGSEVTLREDGDEKVVHVSEVVSSIAFSDDPATEEALRDYQERCQRRGYAPSWGVLVDVLVHDNEGAESGTFGVTLEHVERAIEAMDALAATDGSGAPEQDGDDDGAEVEQDAASDEPDTATQADEASEPIEAGTDEPAQNNVLQMRPVKPKTAARKPRGQAIASA